MEGIECGKISWFSSGDLDGRRLHAAGCRVGYESTAGSTTGITANSIRRSPSSAVKT